VKQALRISLIAATAVAVFAFGIVQLAPGMIVKLFNSDSQVLYNIAIKGLRYVTLAFPLVGFQVVASHYFQAIGKAKISIFATLFRQVILFIPAL
jgi:Na+-driven multidrug efflux pump